MAFTLTMATENAAFEDMPEYEVARILRKVADQIEDGDTTGRVRDINGNTVGAYDLT